MSSKATPLSLFHVSTLSLCLDVLLRIILHSPKQFPSNAFFFTFNTLIFPGQMEAGLLELHILIVVEYLMLLFSPLHPGGVLNGNALL